MSFSQLTVVLLYKLGIVLRWMKLLLFGPASKTDSNAWAVAFVKLFMALQLTGREAEIHLREVALGVSPWIARLALWIGRKSGLEMMHSMAYGRTLLRDRIVNESLERGAHQLITIGGGYEVHSLQVVKQMETKGRKIRVVEVDFPHIQSQKRQRLQSQQLEADVKWVACDFQPGELERLLKEVVLPDAEAVVVIEGVFSYLTHDEARSTLRAVKNAVRKTSCPPITVFADNFTWDFLNAPRRDMTWSGLWSFVKDGMTLEGALMLDCATRGCPLKEGFRLDQAADDYEANAVTFFNYVSTITPLMSLGEFGTEAMAKHVEQVAALFCPFDKYFCAKMEL
ncbi:MAG: uncharacterized protein KVP18_003885 [Porospora cf. gigantea A]|uniref:uncharacterized protein n=1 Tax=Porospora cf. gigantea A TaxID=2853593 RepID=UPI003559CC89|nr:MAG: hypothetical protein KVP18_003885 [Porospora cf. gigantea A]